MLKLARHRTEIAHWLAGLSVQAKVGFGLVVMLGLLALLATAATGVVAMTQYTTSQLVTGRIQPKIRM